MGSGISMSGGKASRDKGRRGEAEFFKLCNAILGEEKFIRHPTPFYGIGKADAHDPEGKLPVCVEVKRCETLALPAWVAQAREQSRPGQVPVLAYRKNQEDWTVLAIMDLNEWEAYLKWKMTL